MNALKLIFAVVIPGILLLFAGGAYHFATSHRVFEEPPPTTFSYETYHLNKTSAWKDRFAHFDEPDTNTAKRRIVGKRGHQLEVRRGEETYLVEYDAEVDVELVEYVLEVKEAGDATNYPARHLIVQYEHFAEIVHYDLAAVKEGSKQYVAGVCLELEVEASLNVRYHTDEQGNIWIVTAPMNKVVFIQVYSCKEGRLIKKIRHVLSSGQFVNTVSKITHTNPDCMTVQVVTYSLDKVDLLVCPYRKESSSISSHSIINVLEVATHYSNRISYQQVITPEWQVFAGNSEETQSEEWSDIINYIVDLLTFSTPKVTKDKKDRSDENQMNHFDAIVTDELNQYQLVLSKNSKQTGLLSLGKYFINSHTPLYHNNPTYNGLGILDILEREQNGDYNPEYQHWYLSKLNDTKRAVYKAAYRTFPQHKIQHLGLGSKVLIFWPSEKLDEKDYTFIRTNDGGVVAEGGKFKGTFDKVPKEFEQVYQLVDSKAIQVVPSIFQVHIGYFNFMTKLAKTKDGFSRVDLMNMLGGKTTISHYISIKSGYAYVSTMLMNNQWWILQYNAQLKSSMATKYELYVNATSPTQIFNVKRVYGVVGGDSHNDGEDKLAELMHEYSNKNGNGYILLNVYRCVDEYYYFEYSDASGSDYGVARVHFKDLSNRQLKKSGKYSGMIEKMLLLAESDMLPERFSRKAYSTVLKNINLFKHAPSAIASGDQSWHSYCAQNSKNLRKLTKSGSYYFFPQQYYSQGNYGCDYNSNQPHPETIYGFNMRNLATNAKILLQTKKDIRSGIIYKLFSFFPIYLAILALVIGSMRFTTQKQSEPQIPKSKKDN